MGKGGDGELSPDGILLQSNDLKIDESALPCQLDRVKKSESGDPMILSGMYESRKRLEKPRCSLPTKYTALTRSVVLFTLNI